jgi:maltooligosyltrehalose trehalohydrolase
VEQPAALSTAWQLKWGATPGKRGVQFRLWAPRSAKVHVELKGKGRFEMALVEGSFVVDVASAQPGDDYLYSLESGQKRPDPVSRHQPDGVHGPSRVVDPAGYQWHDDRWEGIALDRLVLYELHVGTFTAEGTFEGVIARLPHLRQLGVTAISLMPVGQFPGRRNWGYDGVYPYAVQDSYGGPEGLKRLIDAAHQQELAVIMDVVYNHLGPEGNYLAEFGPYFTDHYRTPWGWAINYDGPCSDQVRRYFIDNALYWLTEYHCDGLRLDAVHAIYDFGALHILQELKEAVALQAAALQLPKWVIAESDLNDVRLLNSCEVGGYALDAQWNDDFHHAVHAVLTKRKWSYLVDFGSLADVRKALVEGFVIDGKYSLYRKRRHGSSSRRLPGEKLITFIQNHDQIANAAEGLRLGRLISSAAQRLAAALSICSPGQPLFFMGEEWGATTPFFYFTNFSDAQLIHNVREGRLKESVGEPVDPEAEETFRHSCLNWEELDKPAHRAMLTYYRDLLRLRHERDCLSDCRKDLAAVMIDEMAEWLILNRSNRALLICNFSKEAQEIAIAFPKGRWQPALCSFDAKYGGQGEPFTESVVGEGVSTSLLLPGLGAALFLRNSR